MDKEQQAIEVEVVEIDGVAPLPVTPEHESDPRKEWQDWQKWQGRVRKLDMRWWPLWVVLGAILFILLLTVGLALAILFAIYRIIIGFLRGLASAFK
jgi:hypothetical protein